MAIFKRFLPSFFSSFWIVMMVTVWVMFAPTQAGGMASYVIVIGSSMEPNFHIGDLVVTRREAAYHIGEAVVYRNRELSSLVFHRIIAQKAGRFTLQGDNNSWTDTYQPDEREILGKLWLHLPRGGVFLQKVRDPLNLALLAGALGGVLALALFGSRSRDKKHMAKKSIQEQFASAKETVQAWFARAGRNEENPVPAPISGGSLEGWLLGLGLLAALSLLFGIIAFSRPSQVLTTDDIRFEQLGFFSYSASAPQGVYDSNAVQSGDPIFPKLTCAVDVSFQYTFLAQEAGAIQGSYRLDAILSEPVSGWRRRVPLQGDTAFSGNAFGTTARLNLCEMEKLIQSMEAGTDFHAGSYTLTVTPIVKTGGEVAGQAVDSTFAPGLTFDYDRIHFYLVKGGDGDDPLSPVEEGFVSREQRTANTFPLFGWRLAVPALRVFSTLGLLGSLAGLLLLGLRLQKTARNDPGAFNRIRYDSMTVDVQDAGSLRGSDFLEVASIEDLAKLAERLNTMILHTTEDGAHAYYVRAQGTAYRFAIPVSTGPAVPGKEAEE